MKTLLYLPYLYAKRLNAHFLTLILFLFACATADAQANKQDFKWLIAPKYQSVQLINDSLALVELPESKYFNGFINKEGSMVILPQYEDVKNFSEGLAVVRVGDKVGFINQKGEVKIPLMYEAVRSFKDDLAAVRLNKRWGLIDKSNKLIVEPIFDDYFGENTFVDFSFYDGLAKVKLKNKYGFINKTGKIVITPQYDEASDFENGFATVKLENETLVINTLGEKVTTQSPKGNINQSNKTVTEKREMSATKVGEKYGFVNESGKIVIEPKFDFAQNFSEDLAAVRIKEKFGFIDNTGKMVIAPKYDYAGSFVEGLGIVAVKVKYFIINHRRKTMTPLLNTPDEIFDFAEGLASVKINGKWGFIDTNGKLKIEAKYEEANSFKNGFATVKQNGKYKRIDTKGLDVSDNAPEGVDEVAAFFENLEIFEQGNGQGLREKLTKKVVLEPTFLTIAEPANGLVKIRDINRKWGAVNAKGEIVIKPQYDNIDNNFGELIAVKKALYWGFVDSKNNLVIDFQFLGIRKMSEKGLIWVLEPDFGWGVVDKKGKYVIQSKFRNVSWQGFQNSNAIAQDFGTDLWGVATISILPPTIALTSHEVRNSKISIHQNNLVIKGNATDDIGVRSVKINGKPALFNENGDFILTDLQLAEGEDKIIIEAEDVNSNLTSLTIDVIKEDENAVPQNLRLTNVSSKNYHALVIAVQDYDFISKLKKPLQDADSLVHTLTSLYLFDKENITLLKNPNKARLTDALDSLLSVLTENDNLLIFYAGHGYEDKTTDEGYWFMKGAKTDKRSEWFSNDELKTYIKAMKSRHVLLIADACFAGKLFRLVDNTEPAKNSSAKIMGIRDNYLKKSREGITSTQLTMVPDNSIFLKYLLLSLRENKEKYLRARELHGLFNPLLQNNSSQTSECSTIHETGDEGGGFIFIKKE